MHIYFFGVELAEERIRSFYTADEKKTKKLREVVKETCRKNNIKIEELYYGRRRRKKINLGTHPNTSPIFLDSYRKTVIL
jgi:hypothetical protein